jgi:hypothetical protein
MSDDPSPFVDPDFWQYLDEQAHESDSWWLAGWLKSCLDDFSAVDACPHCGSRRREQVDIWSQTHNHVLEERLTCRHCRLVLSVKDHRPELRQGLAHGAYAVKHVEILQKELGLS